MLIHRGERFQAGRGLGSLFGGLFRTLKPLATMGINMGKRLIQSDLGKKIGQNMLEMGGEALKNVAADAIEGKNVKESLNKELDNAKSRIAQTLRGSGKVKRRKRLQSPPAKKKLKRVRFSLLDDDSE